MDCCNLINGVTIDCHQEKCSNICAKIEAGRVYGQLTAIQLLYSSKGGETWEFRCSCGTKVKRQDFRVVDCYARRTTPMCTTCRTDTFAPHAGAVVGPRWADKADCQHYDICLDQVMRKPVATLPFELRKRDHVCSAQCNRFIKRQDTALNHLYQKRTNYDS